MADGVRADLLHIGTGRVLTTRETVITVSAAAVGVVAVLQFVAALLVIFGVEQLRPALVPLLVILACAAAPGVVAWVDGMVRSRYGRTTGRHGYVEGN